MNWLQKYQCLERIKNYVFVQWNCMTFYAVSLTFIMSYINFIILFYIDTSFFLVVLKQHLPDQVTAKTIQSPIQCWLYNAGRKILLKNGCPPHVKVSFKNIKF